MLAHPALVAAVRSGQFTVAPLTTSQLRAAIVEPARRARLTIDDGLVELLLREAGLRADGAEQDTGVLPLLSHALFATWRHSTDHTLTVADYRAIGGIDLAVATSAEAVFAALDDDGREAARRLVLALVHIATDTADARRVVSMSELFAGHHDARRRRG
jgi:hypothetical protein